MTHVVLVSFLKDTLQGIIKFIRVSTTKHGYGAERLVKLIIRAVKCRVWEASGWSRSHSKCPILRHSVEGFVRCAHFVLLFSVSASGKVCAHERDIKGAGSFRFNPFLYSSRESI